MFHYMTSICVDSRVLGTKQHLLKSSGFSWASSVPKNAWYLSGHIKDDYDMCLDTLLKLECVDLSIEPPERFVNAMKHMISHSSDHWPPPWQYVMPVKAHKEFTRSLIDSIDVAINEIDLSFYKAIWVPGNRVLQSLRSAHVSQADWEHYMSTGGGNVSALKTFLPNPNGELARTTYDRFRSRTGRLSVSSGPDILTLKREHRSILRSMYGPAGTICYLDFAALEARVLLYEAGHRCEDVDLYQYLNNELFGGREKRNNIKAAVISQLYGMSVSSLEKKLDIHGEDLKTFVSKVKGYFNTKKLLKRVKTKFVKDGYIRNRYGRRVNIDEPLDHLFINSYAQSTGVDVAMLGFEKIINDLKDLRARPLFLLHDAIVIDCHNDDIDRLIPSGKVKVKGYVQNFHIRLEDLHVQS